MSSPLASLAALLLAALWPQDGLPGPAARLSSSIEGRATAGASRAGLLHEGTAGRRREQCRQPEQDPAGPALRLHGGARKNTHRRKKTMRLHDYETSKQNEYYAGGLDEQGGGSATVLLYPDEAEFDANATNATNATDAAPPPSKRTYQGTGRSLD